MPVRTNDYRIDALLAGNDIRWGNAIGGSAATEVTFSLMAALPSYADLSQDGNNFSIMTDEQKVAVHEILTTLSSQFNLNFTEVADSAASFGQLRFGNNSQAQTVGYAYYPDSSLG